MFLSKQSHYILFNISLDTRMNFRLFHSFSHLLVCSFNMEYQVILLVLVVVGVLELSLAIPAVVYGKQGDPSCETPYPNIKFTYATWMLWYGATHIINLGVLLVAAAFEKCCEGVGAF